MPHFKKHKLSEAIDLIKDGYLPSSDEHLHYIGLEHIEQQSLRLSGLGKSSDVTSNKFRFKSGDILFGKLRPYFRKVYRPKFDGICSTDIWVARAKRNFDQGFIFYFMANEEFIDLSSQGSSGTRMPRADWNNLKNIAWEFPDKPTQTRIASILSSLDDKIELNRRTNHTLEQIAQTLFKKYFVDDIDPENLPEGWRWGKLGDVCSYNQKTLSKSDKLEWINYVEISEVNKGYISNIARYKRGTEPSRARRILKHGDTILSTVRPDRGSYFLAINPDRELLVSTGFAVFTSKYVPYTYTYLFLTQEESINYYGFMAHGAAYPAINPEIILKMEIAIPPKEVFDEFHGRVESLLLKFHTNNKESTYLSQLRDSLLPKLMSGEIEVNAAEKELVN